jgi:hypothetical protein
MAIDSGTGVELHGTPVPGHIHDWIYVTRSNFSTTYKCLSCMATKVFLHFEEGYKEIIYERNSEYFGGKDKSINIIGWRKGASSRSSA